MPIRRDSSLRSARAQAASAAGAHRAYTTNLISHGKSGGPAAISAEPDEISLCTH
jgi:hypothetical protein